MTKCYLHFDTPSSLLFITNVPSDSHFIISQHLTPNTQAEHVPSDSHFAPLENYFHENNLE